MGHSSNWLALSATTLAVVVTGCPVPPSAELDAATEDAAPLADASDWPWDLARVRSDYCVPLVQLLCGINSTCSCSAGACVGGDESGFTETCVRSFVGSTPNGTGTGVRYDSRRLLATLEQRRAYALSCTTDPSTPTARVVAIVVDALVGEACPAGARDALGCANGDGICRAGTCVPLPGEGDACVDVCALGLACVGGICSAAAEADGACAVDLGCVAPLRCRRGRCAALGAAGAACMTGDDCAPPNDCVSGTCVDATTCSLGCGFGTRCNPGRTGNCVTRAHLGEACGSVDYDCDPSLACSLTARTCVARAALGEACGDLWAERPCVDGVVCAASGTCETPVAPGADCDGSVGCTTGFTCSTTSHTCVPLSAAGGPCASNVDCDAATFCNLGSGTCTARYTSGASCALPGDCLSPLACLPDPGGALHCLTPTPGSFCFPDDVGACGSESLRCVATAGNCFCGV